MEPVYDVDYFIRKFEAIPENRWGELSKSYYHEYERCVLGHCRPDDYYKGFEWYALNEEQKSLCRLLKVLNPDLDNEDPRSAWGLNDGRFANYRQPTPKQRILAALYDIKANQMLDSVKEDLSNPVKKESYACKESC